MLHPARTLKAPPEREHVITNARVVTGSEVVHGTVAIRNGTILGVSAGNSLVPDRTDLEGDLLLPGLIEMHTDNLEKHLLPRPGVEWPSALTALLAHDVQIIGSGITTVLDSIFVGEYEPGTNRTELLEKSIAAIKTGTQHGFLRAEHLLHLRCEYPDAQVLALLLPYADESILRLVSLMDHTPGQRQWMDLSKWRKYHEKDGWTAQEAETVLRRRKAMQQEYATNHREQILAICRKRNLPVASHDDTLAAHVVEGAEQGVSIAEFPTTMEAARTAHEMGLFVIMGAPNLVRGGSHSGNISAGELAGEGLLDGLSSDYAPKSLLHASMILHQKYGYSLPDAVATVSMNIAHMLQFSDRGEIAPGKRADLIRVRLLDGIPVIRTVWRQGQRII
ncbi:MAG: alpha-D-ribose 1-methylphosphonate 5-triphosphate diphosphatase [Desulfovibrionales bacterium]